MAVKWLTEAELRTRWGARVDEFGDRNADGVAEAADVEAAIEIAESRVESDLLGRYQPDDLPTTTGAASAALKRVVGGLAIWFLCESKPIKEQCVYDARSMAEKELLALRNGNLSLLLAGSPTVDLGGDLVLSASGADKVYGTGTSETAIAGGPSRGILTLDTLRDF